jgi:hypothetical protein
MWPCAQSGVQELMRSVPRPKAALPPAAQLAQCSPVRVLFPFALW